MTHSPNTQDVLNGVSPLISPAEKPEKISERFVVSGGFALHGEVQISGSKNSSLPIMAAALLASKGECVLHNVPRISDTDLMCQMLQSLGAKVRRENNAVIVDASNLSTHVAPGGLVRAMRASFYVAAPLLARLRKAEVPLPGGCVLGPRPVNYHIDAFTAMGAHIVVEHGSMIAHAPIWDGATIYLEPKNSSVGATVNIMMAACLANGTTTIENAAREPEVVNLGEFLNKMGGKIVGAGSSTIVIEGVKELHGTEHAIFNDRIEAGTFLAAAGVTGGDITVRGIGPAHLPVFVDKLAEAGLFIQQGHDWIRAVKRGPLRPVDVSTAPFPGFATDLQPPFVAMMLRADGRSAIHENLYDGRFNYIPELARMGADIDLDGTTAFIRGVPKLSGAEVMSTDLRAGAALVLAGLAADGDTEVSKIHYIDRGYENLVGKLTDLGAHITRKRVS
ncbi:UDP-N-acetylglucosamine 1-carboxyvinyltransferase [Abditibacterium utsteinense]|uniref:UDP-N-acetylglucosamine 1-carboxyvinyltransferase n=1 Tax=Abditibacterium utsteinense TaxID=1960156 RepID=A0A2S8SRR0_9BACT|nr:UDP-N-acetylglucosamine 1-carboxyvinyltransferase [Abditibacterium utsteinense]PQV63494.1 UDP-N-acetylglucosamine 1-carboxyvinyltransferase [Abditibacterium utsteinense]